MKEETDSVDLMNSYASELTKEIHRLSDELILTRAKLALATTTNVGLEKTLTELKPEVLMENASV